MTRVRSTGGSAEDIAPGHGTNTKAWLLFIPVIMTVLEWRIQGSERGPQGSVDIGKGVLLAIFIASCVFILGRVDRFRLSKTGRYYFAYCGLALVSAHVAGAWEAPTMRVLRLVLTVLAVLLACEIVARSGGNVLEAFLKALLAILGLFLTEAIIFPELAWQPPAFGTDVRRLQGVLPGVDPNAIGALAGIVLVIAVVAATLEWPRRLWMPAIGLGFVPLVLSRTRIPSAAAFVAIVVALFLLRRQLRARRLLGWLLMLSIIVATLGSGPLWAWVKRDQQTDLIINVSGRTSSWEAVFSQDRTVQEVFLGVGLGAKDVLVGQPFPFPQPIDSSWLATYQQTGLAGVVILMAMVLGGLIGSIRAARADPERAIAVGLYIYLLLWSIAETGFDDASIAVITILIASAQMSPRETPKAIGRVDTVSIQRSRARARSGLSATQR